MTARLNAAPLNSVRLNNGTGYPYSIAGEMRRLRDAQPLTKIEYVSLQDVTTDITAYYISGANFEQIKERAPDEIQSGSFDLVLSNHDNFFSEFDPNSIFFDSPYHGAKIKIYQGFRFPNGDEEYEIQGVGFIDELNASEDGATVILRCRDRIREILDRKLHSRPASEVASAGGSNVGTGFMSIIETLPFKTKNEDWTITCTTPGADGVAEFSVVGSVSGNVGTATSGTEFSTGAGAGGIKFTITGGGTAWDTDDVFTFSTKQYPEWDEVNAAKIIWAILTGYNWDSDTEEAWSDQVLDLDHTKSSANTDIDYDSFVTAVDDLDTIGSFDMAGYIGYDESAVDVIQNLILHFLGSIFTAADGRIKIKTYTPNSLPTATVAAQFFDDRKISSLGYVTAVDEVINYVSIHYKKKKAWQFSNEEVTYDGNYVALDQDSINRYNFLAEGFSSRWYSANGAHAQDFADRLVGKYAAPPLNIDFVTGLDAMRVEIGDVVEVTDEKYSIDAARGEIAKITKNLDESPVTIALRVRRDSDLGILYGFLGSSADEGDGLSPQAADYDSATDSDKTFCYLGEDGLTVVDYRMF